MCAYVRACMCMWEVAKCVLQLLVAVAVKCVSIFPLFRHVVVDKSSKSHIKQPPHSQTPHLQWPHFCSDSFQEVCVCVHLARLTAIFYSQGARQPLTPGLSGVGLASPPI